MIAFQSTEPSQNLINSLKFMSKDPFEMLVVHNLLRKKKGKKENASRRGGIYSPCMSRGE
jgi:valyl-tRNA synthetase